MKLANLDRWLAKKLCAIRGHRWRTLQGHGHIWFCQCCARTKYIEEPRYVT